MPKVSQRYVIDGKDNTKQARKSAERGFLNLDKTVNKLAIGMKGAAVAAGAFAAVIGGNAIKDGIRELSNIQRQMGRITGVIAATGGAAGITASEIREMADAIALTTLENENNVRDAAAQLLTFRTVSGDVFRQTLKLSADLAELGFGTIQRSSVQLAKALEDPIRGLGRLRLVGVSFSPVQEKIIKGFAENNELAKAQGVILDVLAGQVDKVAEAANVGFAGALDTAQQRYRQFTAALAETTVYSSVVFWVERVGIALDRLRAIIAPTSQDIINRLVDQRAEIANQIKALPALAGNIGVLQEKYKELGEELLKVKAVRKDELEAEAKLREAAEIKAKQLAEQAKQQAKIAEIEKADATRKGKIVAILKQMETAHINATLSKEEQLFVELQGLKATDEQIKQFEFFVAQTERKTNAIKRLKKEEEDAAKKSKELKDAAADLGFTFESAFEDAIIEGEKLRDVVKGLIKDIARIALRKAFTEPLGAAVGGAISGLFNNKKGDSFNNQKGGLYKVGGSSSEHPVALNAQSGEHIAVIPRGGGAGGGITINQTFDFTNANPATIALLQQEAEAIKQGAIATIINMRTTGALPVF